MNEPTTQTFTNNVLWFWHKIQTHKHIGCCWYISRSIKAAHCQITANKKKKRTREFCTLLGELLQLTIGVQLTYFKVKCETTDDGIAECLMNARISFYLFIFLKSLSSNSRQSFSRVCLCVCVDKSVRTRLHYSVAESYKQTAQHSVIAFLLDAFQFLLIHFHPQCVCTVYV